jgi:putative transcriptional regulator
MAGVTRQTIDSIESGEYCPSALLAFLLAKKLNKRVEDLFFLKGDDV